LGKLWGSWGKSGENASVFPLGTDDLPPADQKLPQAMGKFPRLKLNFPQGFPRGGRTFSDLLDDRAGRDQSSTRLSPRNSEQSKKSILRILSIAFIK